MTPEVYVLDASVGVKWFRNEVGSDAARMLLRQHLSGEIVIAVDTLFLYEVIAVCARERTPETVVRLWHDLERFELAVVQPGPSLVAAAAKQRTELDCSLYDAFSAGLAALLHAPLYSADARAHAGFANVRLLGA